MRSKNASPRVRVRHMRQPTGWTVPNPDLGDHHFRDKGLPSTCLSRLIPLASPRGNEYGFSELESGCRSLTAANALFVDDNFNSGDF